MNNAVDEKIKKGLILWYYQKTGKWLNLDNPQTFNEKIQWLKLYDNTQQKTLLSDKFLVKNWVKEKIGEEHFIPLLGVYDSFDQIDFKSLPNQFVIKCNHGCGFNIIVDDRNSFDKLEAKKLIDQWMNTVFGQDCYELNYQKIKPKIIIEKFIQQQKETDLYDYKCFCFDGHVEYIQTMRSRKGHNYYTAVYDTHWNKQGWIYVSNANCKKDKRKMKKTKQLEKMISLAEKLSIGFKFVRCDFYLLESGEIYLGEMTFYPMSGIGLFVPDTDKLTSFLSL